MNNSTIEKINEINRVSGISNNMMAYRLSLLMQQAKENFTPLATENQTSPEERQEELSKLLSKSPATENVEDFKQKLKDRYYSEYLSKLEEKLGVESHKQDTATRVERLIAEKKSQFLEMQQSKLAQKPVQNQSKASPEIDSSLPEQGEATNKLLIPAMMGLVVAKGQNTDEKNRIYEGVRYKLQLLMKEGKQFLSINRKDKKPEKAFSAYKNHKDSQFKVLENNLTDEETQGIIAFNQQRIVQEAQNQGKHNQDKDKNAELGD
ncbi:hypothetical protein PN456_05085 [Nodularia spumigena CS-586/05]|uniref:hypothetical protein n=1 Tax=Nodularia spumigena TaxID=70799 RepID=UPI00232E9747|nr:hypothetical protein [Nodularia spumigena]MDB9368333.1 hypothetical protein [Nodularia spumigena CS-586/05]